MSLHAAIGADEESDVGTLKLSEGRSGEMVHTIVNEVERDEDVPLACDAKKFKCNCGIPVSG